ncbi:prepilin peptidase [Bacillus pacificus]
MYVVFELCNWNDMSSYCIYDWGGTRAYYRFITFSLLLIISVTDYIYMLIPNRILAWFACLLILECVFIPLVTWIDSIVGSCSYIHFVILHVKDISRRAWGGDIKLLSLLGFIVGLKGIFIVLFFSILL